MNPRRLGPIWDVHCHLSGVPGRTPDERMSALIQFADRMGIERMCVFMGLSWTPDPSPADLVRQIQLPLSMEFLVVRSYGDGTETSGEVQIVNDLSRPVEGKDVLLVEDIVDTGLTLSFLLDLLARRGPRSVKLAALLHKPSRARVNVRIDYLGFSIEDAFVVGYGLDHAQRYRNLPYIGVLDSP